jgi:histidinol-phosphate phosphatase family protein
MSTPAVFLDRDGTLMVDVDYPREPNDVRVFSDVPASLKRLRDAGFANVIITNQSGIGRGLLTEQQYRAVHERLLTSIGDELITATYYCPDPPGPNALRRKPLPAMVYEAAHDLDLDLARSWFVGDKASDIECGRSAGLRAILVLTGKSTAANPEAGAAYVAKDFATAAQFILENQGAS